MTEHTPCFPGNPDPTQPPDFQTQHRTDYLDEEFVFDPRCPKCVEDIGKKHWKEDS